MSTSVSAINAPGPVLGNLLVMHVGWRSSSRLTCHPGFAQYIGPLHENR